MTGSVQRTPSVQQRGHTGGGASIQWINIVPTKPGKCPPHVK